MKRFLAYVIALLFLVSPATFANAQEKGKSEASKQEGLQEYTVVGILQSKEMTDQEGEGRTLYGIKNEDGVVYKLPSMSEEEAEQYVDKKVKVVAEGAEKTGKKGGTKIVLEKIISIEKVE